ncbi:5-formyltetrahydrofolate cyclo-ligase [Lentisphaerota bacterium WC36G]|nr:5-formyltetrahydrofolate cyclo-ligase [Lentisphaerae bacterium WC36]
MENLKKIAQKKQLRKEFLQQRCTLSDSYRSYANKLVCDNLKSITKLNDCQAIAGYVSDGYEANINKFLQECLNEGKRVFLPRYDVAEDGRGNYVMVEVFNLTEQLVVGKYGILEPAKELKLLESSEYQNICFLIPGVAFDKFGGRLGRGKGFYDQMLDYGGFKIGVFFECQKSNTQQIPMEQHDQVLDLVVTESQIYEF